MQATPQATFQAIMQPDPPTAAELLDRQHLEMRARVLALAADLDRLGRAPGGATTLRGDARLDTLRRAAAACFDADNATAANRRAAAVQMIFSDTTGSPR